MDREGNMRNDLKNLLALGGLMTAAAFAQTTGTVTLTGTIPQAVSLTNASDSALSTTLTLGTLVATNNTTLAAITPLDVHVRSNNQYKLNASMVFTISGAGATAGGDSIAASDIGFGITAVAATGANVATGHTDTLTTKFDYTTTAMSALPNPTGTTPFVAGTNGTLNDISSSTQVVQGTRISRKGNIITPDNFVKLTFGAATLPQYFTPNTGFQAVITLTVVTF
jgi:hypothetical protein